MQIYLYAAFTPNKVERKAKSWQVSIPKQCSQEQQDEDKGVGLGGKGKN